MLMRMRLRRRMWRIRSLMIKRRQGGWEEGRRLKRRKWRMRRMRWLIRRLRTRRRLRSKLRRLREG